MILKRECGLKLKTTERDIYASAKLLLDQHGLKGASEYAAGRMQTMRDVGDEEGVATWGRIRAALLDLSDVRFKNDALN
jgi:hypothetical protein